MPLRHMLGVSSPHRVVYIIMSCWLARLPRSPATCQVSQFYEAKGLNVTNIQNPGSELVPGKTEGLYFLTCSHLAGLIPGQGTRDWFPCVTTGKALDSGPDAKCLTWQHRDLGWECSVSGDISYTPALPGKRLSRVPFLGNYGTALTTTNIDPHLRGPEDAPKTECVPILGSSKCFMGCDLFIFLSREKQLLGRSKIKLTLLTQLESLAANVAPNPQVKRALTLAGRPSVGAAVLQLRSTCELGPSAQSTTADSEVPRMSSRVGASEASWWILFFYSKYFLSFFFYFFQQKSKDSGVFYPHETKGLSFACVRKPQGLTKGQTFPTEKMEKITGMGPFEGF